MSNKVNKRNLSLTMQHILKMSKMKPSTANTTTGRRVMTMGYKGKTNLEFKLKNYDAMTEKLFKGKGKGIIDYKYANGNCNSNRMKEVEIEIEREEGEDNDNDNEMDVSFNLMDTDVDFPCSYKTLNVDDKLNKLVNCELIQYSDKATIGMDVKCRSDYMKRKEKYEVKDEPTEDNEDEEEEEDEYEESKNTKTLNKDKNESSSSSSSSSESSSSKSKDKPNSNVSVHEEEEEESNISKPSMTSSYITDKKDNEQQPSVKSITSNGSRVYRPSFSNQPDSITVSVTNTPKKSNEESQSNLNISVSATPVNRTPDKQSVQAQDNIQHKSESKLQKPIQNKENHIYHGRDKQSGNYYSIYVDKFVSEDDVIYITSLFIKIYKSDSDETVVETKSIKELLGIDSIKKEDAVGYVGDIIKKLNTKVDDDANKDKVDDDDEYANEFMDDQFEVAVLEEEL